MAGLVSAALVTGFASTAVAEGDTLFDAIKGGKPLINIRYRFENVDQDNIDKNADANTLRTRIGYETAWWNDLQAMVEFENITVVGGENYNDTLNGKAQYPIVADPEDTELNQAYGVFKGIPNTILKGGRQRIKIMNDRFIGNVGFRQNEQTYDSVVLVNTSVPNLTATYAYVWNVNRINGNDHPLGDLNTNTHWGSLSYKSPVGALTGYGLFIDLDKQSGGAVAGLSSQTFGARFEGSWQISEKVKALYALDYAHQTDQGDNPADFDHDYFLIEPGISSGGATAKFGYEVLDGDGMTAFQTPLATLHAFQGVTDVFLVTPAMGIEDLYAKAKYKIPGEGVLSGIVLSGMFHDFQAEKGGADYGTEWDIKIAKTFATAYGKFVLSAEHAAFDGQRGSGFADRNKTWLTLGIIY